MNQGKTLDALGICQSAIADYHNLAGAKIYIGYLYLYEAEAFQRLGDISLSRYCYQAVAGFLDPNDPIIRKTIPCNLTALELEARRFEPCLKLGSRLINDYTLNLDFSQKAVVINNIAEAAVQLGNYELSDSLFNTLFIWMKEKSLGNGFDSILTYRNYGRFKLKIKDFKSARIAIDLALKYANLKYGDLHYQTGRTWQVKGNLYAKLNLTDSAVWCYRQASKSLLGKDSSSMDSIVGIRPVNYETLFIDLSKDKGDLETMNLLNLPLNVQIMKLEKSIEFYGEGLNRLDYLMQYLVKSESGFVLADKGRSLIESILASNVNLYLMTGNEINLKQAFAWSLTAKGLSMRAVRFSEMAMIQDDSIESSDMDIYRIRSLLYETSKPDLTEQTQLSKDSLTGFIQKYQEAQNKRKVPHLADVFNAWSSGEVEQQIKSFTGSRNYIGYHDQDTSLCVFLISKGNLSLRRISFTENMADSIQRYNKALSDPQAGNYENKDVKEFFTLSNYLFEILVKPILSEVGEGKLFFQTDGRLTNFSFDALTEDLPSKEQTLKQTEFRQLPYIGKRFQISYLTGMYQNYKTKDHSKKHRPLLLMLCSSDTTLQSSQPEIDAISKEWPNHKILNLGESELKISDFDRFSSIHFAGHIKVNYDDAFGTSLGCFNHAHGVIRLAEIINSRIRSDLVFLNGCESANGPLNATDGRLSPALFFLLAGVKGAVEHLWKAPDKAGALIAIEFYRNYPNEAASTALYYAKMHYLESCESGLDHPHYWAGVVYTSSIEKEQPRYWLFILLIALSILFVLWWATKRS